MIDGYTQFGFFDLVLRTRPKLARLLLELSIIMYTPSDDIELMRRIAERDQQALMELYQQYGKAVYSLAYRVLGNATFAEEAMQDTFLKVWHQTTRWDSDKGKLKNWLLTIAQLTAIGR